MLKVLATAGAVLALATGAAGAQSASSGGGKTMGGANTPADQQSRMASCSNQYKQLQVIKQTLGRTRADFMKVCLSNNAKTVPVAPNTPTSVAQTVNGSRSGPVPAPTGTTAKCKDGTYWSKAEMRGACSGHGGIAAKIK